MKPTDVGAEHPGQWRDAVASALDWWRDAGVDVLVEDGPRDWLAREAAPVPVEAPVPAPDALPRTMPEFLAWRGGEGAPEAAWRGVSLTASGPADARLMVLVDCPDRDDADCLLSGKAGKLFDRMLAAIGVEREAIHLAAVCVRRPATGRMPRELEAELQRLARHHLGLVAPARVLLLGDAASRALTGTEVLRARGSLRRIKHDAPSGVGGETDAVATFHPRLLLERPAQKADAWRDLQLLMRTG